MHALCGLHQGTKENQQTTQQKRPETQHAPLHTTTPAEHTLHLPCHWKLRCTCHTVTRNRTSNKKRRRELRTLYRLHQTTDEDQQTTQRKRPASQARLRASQASQNYGHKRGTDPPRAPPSRQTLSPRAPPSRQTLPLEPSPLGRPLP